MNALFTFFIKSVLTIQNKHCIIENVKGNGTLKRKNTRMGVVKNDVAREILKQIVSQQHD